MNSTSSVTVILRSVGRPSLTEALASVARQEYRGVSALVVDATGSDHPVIEAPPGLELRMCSAGRPLGRVDAANFGLEQARGDYLIFLDDDDWFDRNHVSSLLSALEQRPDAQVAYSGIRLMNESGAVGEVLNQPFYRPNLHRANYIAMTAALFSRELVDAGCRFDTSLQVYEDWDFWLELSTRTNFVHTRLATVAWRADAGSSRMGTGKNADAALKQQAEERIKAKWRPLREKLDADYNCFKSQADALIAQGKQQEAQAWLAQAYAVAAGDLGQLRRDA
jgi:glycosyltransferase involved in cell wall biosynthesis